MISFVIESSPIGSTTDSALNKLEPIRTFIIGETFNLDLDLFLDDSAFNLQNWQVRAKLFNANRQLIAIFTCYKFQDDLNRIRLVANYLDVDSEGLSKGFYKNVDESNYYYIYIELDQGSEKRSVLPVPIFVHRMP